MVSAVQQLWHEQLLHEAIITSYPPIFTIIYRIDDATDSKSKSIYLKVLNDMLNGNPKLVHTRDSFEKTPLHNAVLLDGDVDIITVLLDHGADPEARDMWKKTPLHYAVENAKTQAVGILIERGADVNALEEYNLTPLHYISSLLEISEPYNKDRLKIAEALLSAGADKKIKDKDGETAISHLMRCSDIARYRDRTEKAVEYEELAKFIEKYTPSDLRKTKK